MRGTTTSNAISKRIPGTALRYALSPCRKAGVLSSSDGSSLRKQLPPSGGGYRRSAAESGDDGAREKNYQTNPIPLLLQAPQRVALEKSLNVRECPKMSDPPRAHFDSPPQRSARPKLARRSA